MHGDNASIKRVESAREGRDKEEIRENEGDFGVLSEAEYEESEEKLQIEVRAFELCHYEYQPRDPEGRPKGGASDLGKSFSVQMNLGEHHIEAIAQLQYAMLLNKAKSEPILIAEAKKKLVIHFLNDAQEAQPNLHMNEGHIDAGLALVYSGTSVFFAISDDRHWSIISILLYRWMK